MGKAYLTVCPWLKASLHRSLIFLSLMTHNGVSCAPEVHPHDVWAHLPSAVLLFSVTAHRYGSCPVSYQEGKELSLPLHSYLLVYWKDGKPTFKLLFLVINLYEKFLLLGSHTYELSLDTGWAAKGLGLNFIQWERKVKPRVCLKNEERLEQDFKCLEFLSVLGVCQFFFRFQSMIMKGGLHCQNLLGMTQ